MCRDIRPNWKKVFILKQNFLFVYLKTIWLFNNKHQSINCKIKCHKNFNLLDKNYAILFQLHWRKILLIHNYYNHTFRKRILTRQKLVKKTYTLMVTGNQQARIQHYFWNFFLQEGLTIYWNLQIIYWIKN